MKIPNPIKDYREKKAEEKRRKEAEEKKQQKRTLQIYAGTLAALFVIIGIGALTEDDTPQLPESSSQTVTIVDEFSTFEESEPSVSGEPDLSKIEFSEPPLSQTEIRVDDSSPEISSKPDSSDIAFSDALSSQTEIPVYVSSTSEETTLSISSKPDLSEIESTTKPEPPKSTTPVIDLNSIPAYSGSPYVEINGNVPGFTDADLTTTSFETYRSLDNLGRCGVAYANIGTDLMPTEEREAIGQVKPTGWHTVKYNGVVDGNYLYNRCHLIGFQLTAENANTKNLITGTRYLNVEGMLPFENMVADYIKETDNHVLYRVTPVFEGDNLVASGVVIEAKSVEDNGDGILFNVYCYNVQPGITIDYATGNSALNGEAVTETPVTEPAVTTEPETPPASSSATYILNINTKKFHYPFCSSVDQMSNSNKKEYSGSRDYLISQGYDPCKRCNP